MLKNLWLICIVVGIITITSLPEFDGRSISQATPLPADAMVSPGRTEVCAIVLTMPDAEDTDIMLERLQRDRPQNINDLEQTSRNLHQYDAEGYGWQNIIDSPDALEPQAGGWLLGALRMACEDGSPGT
jgi:hypothetical protein